MSRCTRRLMCFVLAETGCQLLSWHQAKLISVELGVALSSQDCKPLQHTNASVRPVWNPQAAKLILQDMGSFQV